MTDPQAPKSAWTSKTILANAVLGMLAFVPGWQEFVAANPEVTTILLAVVGIVLRLVTKTGVVIR